MYYVYILRRVNHGLHYKGYTADLKKRLSEHNSGQSIMTKPYIPWKLLFYAAFETELLAKNFEKYLKTGSGWGFARKRFINVST
jgi:predicted GIY-YIG superfamily endonuclease